MATDVRLYPTPTRLTLLAEAIQDRLFGPSAAVDALKAAGWIEPYPPPSSRYRATAYGRAIAMVRVLDFGGEIWAECGGTHQPRHLATAIKKAGRTWHVSIDGTTSPVTAGSRHDLREELRHQAAQLLAAELTATTEDAPA